MADDEKLVLKPDVLRRHLTNLEFTEDKQSLLCDTLDLHKKRIESLNNSMLEIKHISYLNLSNNSIVDISVLSNFLNLKIVKVSYNKIKHMNAFTNEEAF